MVVVFAEDCRNRGFVCLCVRLVNAVILKGTGETHKALREALSFCHSVMGRLSAEFTAIFLFSLACRTP